MTRGYPKDARSSSGRRGLDRMRVDWRPATVTWVGFLAVAAIVTGVGLLGSRYVIHFLQDQFILHGVDHNRELTRRLQPLLQGLLAETQDPARALEQFRTEMAEAERFGMSVFVFDRRNGRVVTHSDPGVEAGDATLDDLVFPPFRRLSGVEDDALPCPGALVASTPGGRPALLYVAPVDAPGPAAHWALAVQTEITELVTSVERFRGHVTALLLATDALIALLGFAALRHVGRLYERSLEARLVERTGELEAAHAEVLRKNTLATIGQTASTLAHEMRNPLASIKLSLSGLHGVDYLRDRERRRVDVVVREVDRLDALLSETLDYVRPVRPSALPVALDALLDQVVEVVAPLLEARRLRLERRTCPACPGIRLDTEQVRQALLNLLKNAIEAAPEEGLIGLETRMEGGMLAVAIHNGGPPIPAEDLPHLFDAFFSTKPRGSGLGLTLVKRVIDEHGGALAVASDAENGTRFTVTLPLE